MQSYLYAANQGAKIVSTSYNIDSWPGDTAIEKALEYMELKGMLHFNSAGNSGRNQPNRTKLKNVILVASTQADGKNDDKRSSFSNYGAGIDIAAPGGGAVGILATLPNNKYGRMSGTSMAAPVVSGVAALTQTMEDGRTQMVGLLLPSDFVGRPGRERATYTVSATSDLVMCCFRKRPFEQLMTETPHVAQRLLEMTLDELDAAREWLLILGRKTAREKIASLLSIIARRDAA